MPTRPPLRALAALLAPVLVAVGCGEPRRPNVLLISLDSVGRDHVSAYGYQNPLSPATSTTPLIERLADEGALFEDAVSTTSWTLPAHMALMTGLADPLHGVTDNHKRLHGDVVTLAEWLGAAGYSTAGFFSGPNLHPAFGFAQGFERYVNCGVATPLEAFESGELGAFREFHEASHASVTGPELLEQSGDWIRRAVREDDGPFFAFVHWWDPHYDYKPPPEHLAQFDPDYPGPLRGVHRTESKLSWTTRDLEHLVSLYDAEIRYTDDVIDRLLAELEALGVLDDTIVVVVADHGEEFYQHGRWGHQRTLFDEVVRIPLALRWPGGIPAGARPAGQARIQDVLPTLAELLDLAPPEPIEGRSLVPLWREPDHPGHPQLLSLAVPYREIDLVGLRHGSRKLIWDRGLEVGWLFDLDRDPGELRPRELERLDPALDPAVGALLELLGRFELLGADLPEPGGGGALPDSLRRELSDLGYLDAGD